MTLFLTIIFGMNGVLSSEENEYSKFIQISSNLGLPGTTVRCMLQDQNGFVWLGVEGVGLAKYDGHNFQLFTIENTEGGLCDAFVESLFEDEKGNIWIGTAKGVSLFDPSSNRFQNYQSIADDPNTLPGSVIYDIQSDSHGRVWIGTNGGVCFFENESFHRILLTDPLKNEVEPRVSAIHLDSFGHLWLGTRKGLHVITFDESPSETPVVKTILDTQGSFQIFAIEQDNQGLFWLGTDNGIKSFDKGTGELVVYTDPDESETTLQLEIRSILKDNNGMLWVATWVDGIRVIDPITKKQKIVVKDIRYKDSLKSSTIRALMMDRSGLIWIGTKYEGVQLFDPRRKTFQHHRGSSFNKNGLEDPYVATMCSDGKNIYLGTVLKGLYRYNPAIDQYHHFPLISEDPNGLINPRVQNILIDSKKRYWVCSDSGLSLLDPTSDRFVNFEYPFCRFITELPTGMMLVGTRYGLIYWNPETLEWVKFDAEIEGIPIDEFDFIESYEDSEKRLWIASRNRGIYIYDYQRNTLTSMNELEVKNGDFVKVTSPREFFETKNGDFWIGTKLSGLFRRKSGEQDFVQYNEENGFVTNTLFEMQESNGELWLSSMDGLIQMDTDTGAWERFGMEYGLQSLVFEYGSSCKTEDERLFFGGNNGFNSFNPQEVKSKVYEAPLVFSAVHVKDSVVAYNTQNPAPLKLRHDRDNISFYYSLQDFSYPGRNQYSCQLIGFDPKPSEFSNLNFATYTALDPGEYVFQVTAKNPDDRLNQHLVTRRIEITILSPFWETWPFRAFLVFLVIGLIYGGHLVLGEIDRQQKRKLEKIVADRTARLAETNEELMCSRVEIEHQNLEIKTHRDELEKLVYERTEELAIAKDKAEESDRVKSAFLANMSHEIRTPLNAILGFSDIIREETESNDQIDEYHRSIRLNGSLLLSLINDIIDTSIIESGHLKVFLEETDVHEFYEQTSLQFREYVKTHGDVPYLEENRLPKDRSFSIHIDANRLKQVLSNLLSNACKFTKEGSITLGAEISEEKEVVFYVRDTGRGIPAEAHKAIFERFEKVEEEGHDFAVGSGLGLSISTYLVRRMTGKIAVESEQGKGSKFIVTLPMLAETPRKEMGKSIVESENDRDYDWSDRTFLVAEDISFNFKLIERIMKPTGVHLEWVKDGDEAVAWLENAKAAPDLMLLDIKLPKRDGIAVLEVAKKVFPDVPAVAQTAYALVDEQKRILAAGFSDCIIKPFNRDKMLQCLGSYLLKK